MPAHPLRLAGFFLTTVLLIWGGPTGCSAPDATATAVPAAQASPGPVCRIGPDGGPPEAGQPVAERGIGGTGKPSNAVALVQTADRGIGGTGIVGVVTGFASICVDGIEVPYDRSAAVDIDGVAGDTSQLRVGDVVAIRTLNGSAPAQARSIAVRIEATGRIESLSATTGVLRVAGQAVLVAAGIPGADRFTLGDWVAVSGLRRPDGVIMATRLDAAPVNVLSVRGRVDRYGGAPHLGALVLPAGAAKPGAWVHVTGGYDAGTPHAASVSADTLCPTPYLCFAGTLDRILVEAYVRSEGAHVRMDGMLLPAQGAAVEAGVNGAAIVSLERRPDGTYAALDVRSAIPAPKATFYMPPPMPEPVSEALPRPSRAAALAERASGAGHGMSESVSSIASLSAEPADLDAGSAAAVTQANPPMVWAPADVSVPVPAITQQAGAASVPGAGVSGGDAVSAQQISGAQAADPGQTLAPPAQTQGSPLPASDGTGTGPGGANVPISSNLPAQGRGAYPPSGLSQQTILTTGALTGPPATGGHPVIPIGSAPLPPSSPGAAPVHRLIPAQ